MVNWNRNVAKLILPTPFPVGDVNVFLVKGDALTLFDTGVKTKETKEALDNQLRELGLTLKDIEQVILTHHHPDHAGALDFFENAPVYAHKNNQRWLEWNDEFAQLYYQFFFHYGRQFGVAEELRNELTDYHEEKKFFSSKSLSGFLAEGDSLPGLPGWTAIETLGHAQGHLSFYREQDGLLIGGDLLLEKVSPNPIMEPPFESNGERPRPLLQHNESLKKIREMPISVVYSGHGADIEEVRELIDFRMIRQHDRAMKVKKMLEEKPLTAFEVCQHLFPKIYHEQLGLTLSETIGQLDYLEDLGKIQSVIEAGVMRFLVE